MNPDLLAEKHYKLWDKQRSTWGSGSRSTEEAGRGELRARRRRRSPPSAGKCARVSCARGWGRFIEVILLFLRSSCSQIPQAAWLVHSRILLLTF